MLFADNLKVLSTFLRKAETVHLEDEPRQKQLELSIKIISYMQRLPEDWDRRCSYNLEHMGDRYLDYIRDFDPTNIETINSNIDHLYTISYRFLCEFDFLIGAGQELGTDLDAIKYKILNDDSANENVRSSIIYASYAMPADIVKKFINDSNIGVFKDFEDTKNEAVELKEKWDKEIQEKKEDVSHLKDHLDEYKMGFNFVGLYQGFLNLGSQKKGEARSLFWSLLLMGTLILTPLVIGIFVAVSGLINEKNLGADHLMVFLPLFSLEIILIYFFRIILQDYRSVKAQKMQIELRQTLCQFIQSYAEYSAKIKKEGNTSLEKFESLIFSGVLSNPEKLPSTFDGLDQLGNMIKNLKGT